MEITGTSKEEIEQIKKERFGDIETVELSIEQLNEIKELLEEKLDQEIDQVESK
jgi:hypothetical protein